MFPSNFFLPRNWMLIQVLMMCLTMTMSWWLTSMMRLGWLQTGACDTWIMMIQTWCSAVIPDMLILSRSMSTLARLSMVMIASPSLSRIWSSNTTSSGNLTLRFPGFNLANTDARRDMLTDGCIHIDLNIRHRKCITEYYSSCFRVKYFSSLSDVCVLCEIQLSTEQWYEMMMSTILGLHHTGPHSTMVTGHSSSTTPGESVCWHHQTISSLSVTNHCSVEAGDQWSQDKARLWSQVSVWWWWPGLTPVSHLTLLTTAHWKLTIFRNHLIFITSQMITN